MNFQQRLQRIDVIVSTDGTQALVDERGDSRVLRFRAFTPMAKDHIRTRAERYSERIRWNDLDGEVRLP